MSHAISSRDLTTSQGEATQLIKRSSTLDEERKEHTTTEVRQRVEYKYKKAIISSKHNSLTYIVNKNDTKEILFSRDLESENILRLQHRTVSKRHALIKWSSDSDTFILRDEGSTAGTYIRIQEYDIAEGDILEMGNFQYSFERLDSRAKTLVIKIQEELSQAKENLIGFEYRVNFKEKKVWTIGISETCDVLLKDRYVDPIHAELVLNDEGPVLIVKSSKSVWKRLSPSKTESDEHIIPPIDIVEIPMKIRIGEQFIKIGFE
eukprot:TRINITY_DN2323_c0_g2_i2.p1 TRINITY_DN2323_c0_g2~~TRINITY_DN2323_c0_g2_i2.p1  ORF type:complete len:263 (-),score=38.39 TRINITY_DN2323_c0_g2_i2:26-814(-)